MNKSDKRFKVYGFTNENVTSYGNLYNLDNAKVLSVIGSGDHYFTCILNGAKEVDLYDINVRAWSYFVLKFYAIRILEFDEFYDFFVRDKLNNIDIYNKIEGYLPYDVKSDIELFFCFNKNLSEMILNDSMGNFNCFSNSRVIPYFDSTQYYRLQSLLSNRQLPNVYFYNLIYLPYFLNSKYYEILFTSNIYKWLSLSVKDYKELLLKFNIPTIQALYSWNPTSYLKKSFLLNGFTIDFVDSYLMGKQDKNDYVFTLKK